MKSQIASSYQSRDTNAVPKFLLVGLTRTLLGLSQQRASFRSTALGRPVLLTIGEEERTRSISPHPKSKVSSIHGTAGRLPGKSFSINGTGSLKNLSTVSFSSSSKIFLASSLVCRSLPGGGVRLTISKICCIS